MIKVTYSDIVHSEKYYEPTETWNWQEQNPIYFREQGDSIYYTNLWKDYEVLRYDFDWHVGKQIPTYYDWYDEEFEYTELEDIRKIELLDGKIYNCIWFHTFEDSVSSKLYLIRGIGFVDNNRGIFDCPYGIPISLKYYDYKVRYFIRKGQLIYKWDRDVDFILGLNNAESDDIQKRKKTYTVYGTEVDAGNMQSLPRGIYIRDGKKFVVK
ncbi:MAG: hypothetical protein SOZ80_05730 [Prevotella sp.]|uniref:hypothetical protein n=1 Tax=Prevotella sp. TaxID=59823 RepID=UPI002A2AA641|nr:hypothetical protein [Prevotella sp.]MDD7318387.1 hypothetical protein [Prevotellaceae bacterium]MDY4020262.1 hypothetical protein [Prevotella sp.]